MPLNCRPGRGQGRDRAGGVLQVERQPQARQVARGEARHRGGVRRGPHALPRQEGGRRGAAHVEPQGRRRRRGG